MDQLVCLEEKEKIFSNLTITNFISLMTGSQTWHNTCKNSSLREDEFAKGHVGASISTKRSGILTYSFAISRTLSSASVSLFNSCSTPAVYVVRYIDKNVEWAT